MMNSLNKNMGIKIFAIATLVTVSSVTPVSAWAQGWSAPTSAPPGGNVAAPLNVGSQNQVKSGGISVGAITITGGALLQGNFSAGGAVQANAYCFNSVDGSPTSDSRDCVTSWSGSGGGIPAGAVMAFDLHECPAGWARFTQAYDRTIVGAGQSYALRALFGEAQHTLTIAEMPSHSHRLYAQNAVESYNANQGFLNGNVGVAGKQNNGVAYMTSNANGNQLIESTGGGQPHNNIQPSIALLYCKKS